MLPINKYRHLIKEKKLFAFIMRVNNLKNDRELCDFLVTSPSIISQIRNDKIRMSSDLLLRVYDKTTLSIEEIRKMVKEDV